MAKNPVIKKAYENGKLEGYTLGLEHGEQRGIRKTVDFIAVKFASLPELSGIGPKTLEKIKKAIGEEYFQSEED
jgi:hypothetical protein